LVNRQLGDRRFWLKTCQFAKLIDWKPIKIGEKSTQTMKDNRWEYGLGYVKMFSNDVITRGGSPTFAANWGKIVKVAAAKAANFHFHSGGFWSFLLNDIMVKRLNIHQLRCILSWMKTGFDFRVAILFNSAR
jgi:hypothetical protein